MENNIVDRALDYAARGWKVFPLHTMRGSACSCGKENCQSAAKHPHIKEWQHHCSFDSEAIREWWRKWPDANIGLATGVESGFFVLDVDPRHGGKESLQQLVKRNGSFPKTLASNTGGGGYHLFFKTPEIKVTNRTNILPGIDVRGDGGYIVAPPSIHKSGLQYSWMKEFIDNPINDPPHWLLQLFFNKQFSRTGFGHLVFEGGRNSFLFSEAGKLRNMGLDQNQLQIRLKEINSLRCSPPLSDDEVQTICMSIARYPANNVVQLPSAGKFWTAEPEALELSTAEAPVLTEDLLPVSLKPWIMDISERMQVTPEFVMAPALVSLSAVVGRKIGILPKKKDDWLVVPNLWGVIVARPGYFKSPTIAEAMKPMDELSEKARAQDESSLHHINASKMIAMLQLEAAKDNIKKAIKESDFERLESLKTEVAQLEEEHEAIGLQGRRYKTNDATVEKIARLLNENPNGLLLLRDELNGWLQSLNKTGREGDREFYLEAWNGYGSYTVDRVGSGTLHVPALCLSVFGGIQPGKLQNYVEKTLRCGAEDDGLLQRFQMLVYPEFSPEWRNVDRDPDIAAREQVCEMFRAIDRVKSSSEAIIPSVRFSDAAQEAFDAWRTSLESRLRSHAVGCPVFESHLAKYRSLMPTLSLLFWLLEDVNNIHSNDTVSFSAATLAIRWCDFLEKHALKAYRIGQSSEELAVKKLADCIKNGQVPHKFPVRSLYRKHWRQINTPHLVDHALEHLEDLNWLRVVSATVQGGSSKRIMLHPKFQLIAGGTHE